jgi:hypothetical protein
MPTKALTTTEHVGPKARPIRSSVCMSPAKRAHGLIGRALCIPAFDAELSHQIDLATVLVEDDARPTGARAMARAWLLALETLIPDEVPHA